MDMEHLAYFVKNWSCIYFIFIYFTSATFAKNETSTSHLAQIWILGKLLFTFTLPPSFLTRMFWQLHFWFFFFLYASCFVCFFFISLISFHSFFMPYDLLLSFLFLYFPFILSLFFSFFPLHFDILKNQACHCLTICCICTRQQKSWRRKESWEKTGKERKFNPKGYKTFLRSLT